MRTPSRRYTGSELTRSRVPDSVPDAPGQRTADGWPTVALVYIAASLAFHHRVLGDLAGRATGWVSSDSGLFTWWLAWTAHAVTHGTDPLLTTWQNAPEGVNAMWNTSVPVLGMVLAPLTLSAGATVAFNVGMIAGPVVSGIATFAALRPWVERTWVRGLAGGLFAFGPFIVAHASVGHLNLVWSVLPPAMLWAVRAVFVAPHRPWRSGALLGLAFAGQALLYTQTVALGAIALLVVGGVLALRWPREALARVPAVARSAASCVGVFVLLAGYPLYLVLAGPGRPRIPVRDAARTGADAANLVVPSDLTKLSPGTADLAGQLRAHSGEQGSYLGVGMLAVVLVAVLLVRSPLVRVAAAVGSVLAVLSLGTTAVALGTDTGVWLPWRLVLGLPLVGEAEAGRLAPFVALCVVVVVSGVLDRAARERRWWVVATVTGIAVATWLPSDSQQFTPVTVPPFFTRAADHLAPGEIVETWPRPSGRWVGGADPLVWQARSGMAFRQTGGYFIGSDRDHPLLLEGTMGAYQHGAAGARVDPAMAGSDLRRRGVTAVVVAPGPGVDTALAWTREVTVQPGEPVGGVWLFRVG